MKKYAIPIIFAVMLVAGLGVSYLYNDRPAATVGDALRNLKDSRSVMAAVTVATFAPESIVRSAGADPNLVYLPVVFVGEAAMNLPGDKPMSGAATFVLVGGEEDAEITFDVIVSDDGTSYVKFANVPQEKTTADVVEELNGKWYSMRSRGLVALLAKDGDATANDVDPSGKPSNDAWTRIEDSVSSGALFGPPIAFGAQITAPGAASLRRYQLPFNHDALVRLATDIKTIVRGRALTELERAEIVKSMADRDVTLEVWIDRRSKQVAQMNLDVKSLAEGADAAKGKTSLLSVVARFTSWNEPVEVKAPAVSQPFAELIENLKKRIQ